MIDAAALKRDARGCIGDWPVTIRHYYSPTLFDTAIVGLNAKDDLSQLMEAGLLDKPDVDIISIVDDFPHGLPANRDRIDLLIDPIAVTYVQLEVKRTPDAYDPLGPTYQFTIGSPNI